MLNLLAQVSVDTLGVKGDQCFALYVRFSAGPSDNWQSWLWWRVMEMKMQAQSQRRKCLGGPELSS